MMELVEELDGVVAVGRSGDGGELSIAVLVLGVLENLWKSLVLNLNDPAISGKNNKLDSGKYFMKLLSLH